MAKKKEVKHPSIILEEKLEKHRLNCKTCLNPKMGRKVFFKNGDQGICENSDEVLEPYKDQIEKYEVFTYPCPGLADIKYSYPTKIHFAEYILSKEEK